MTAYCKECGHPVAEHQPAYAVPSSRGALHAMVGCSICNCMITMQAKMRAWGEVGESGV